MNNLQPNPAHAEAATFVQPDWNAAYGEGVAAPADAPGDYAAMYTSARAGEKARVA